MTVRIGVVAPGGMGAAIAARLCGAGADVLTSLEGRSAASRERATAAGMRDVGDAGLAEAAVILSVVPPDQALPLARRLSAAVAGAGGTPIYVDCNAVGPGLAAAIADAVEGAGVAFVDGGLIGLPPRPDAPGPTLFLSGARAEAVSAMLAPLGLRTHVLDGPSGAASALKMAYAGITKGLIAIAATMGIAAQRHGVGDALVAELARSQPGLFQGFTRSVPDMLGKARRWVPEMHEIEGFVGDDARSAEAYGAFARLYEQVAEDPDLRAMLADFYTAPDSGRPA